MYKMSFDICICVYMHCFYILERAHTHSEVQTAGTLAIKHFSVTSL